jgi:hypothetical protein
VTIRETSRAVAIGVGLHDGGDFHPRTHHSSDGEMVAGDLLPGDQDVGTVKGGRHLLF